MRASPVSIRICVHNLVAVRRSCRKKRGVQTDKGILALYHHHSSLGSRCVPWLGEGLSMSSPNYPVLCCPLPYRVAPVFVQVVSPPLGWSPLSSFLVIWSPSGDARGPSVVFDAVNMPCPGPFHFSHSVDYIYEFCPLPDPDVGPSIFVCDVEHTSFHFGLCGRKFVLCLFGQCPGLCTICYSWQHTGVVHLSLQADGNVAFEYITVFGVCRPSCHDSSLYLFVLVLFLEAVVLSQVHVAWDIFYQHIVHIYRGVVYNHHLCLCDVHLKTHSSTFIVLVASVVVLVVFLCIGICHQQSGDWREILRLSSRPCSPSLTF